MATETAAQPTETNRLDPSTFAFLKLGLDPYGWQVEALEAIGARERVSLVAANGSGKTAVVVAASVLWFLATFPKGRVVVTSGVFRQVKEQLWRALEEQQDKFPDWTWTNCLIKTPQGGFAIGFATNEAQRAEGWHNGDGMEYLDTWDEALEDEGDWDKAIDALAEGENEAAPLYFIIDEAKEVKDTIFTAVARCAPQYRLYTSSPGPSFGKFYRTHCAPREMKHYYRLKVPSSDCPHITKEHIEQDRDELDEVDFKSIHEAEFVDDGTAILSPQAFGRAMARQPEPDRDGERVGFCDFAAGGDENVFAMRQGNEARIVECWKDRDTTRATAKFIRLFRENGFNPGEVHGDADGLGWPMIVAAQHAGFYIVPFHGGQPPPERQKIKYQNLISYVWFDGCNQIRRGLVNIGEVDLITEEQITSRPRVYKENGKLAAMDKEKMRAQHGIRSPDRADALLGSIVCGARLSGSITARTAETAQFPDNPFGVEHVSFSR